MTSQSTVFQLSGTCNNYGWGRKGRDSLAARLCENSPGDFKIDDNEAYSEMWFGDYPDFPARVLETGELLKDVLDRNKETLLGPKVVRDLDAQLPYLPKILSIAKALPLQIHPNKSLASRLHEQDPEAFTDPNHKPEIAVALGRFEVFAGFKPLDRIAPVFDNISALRRAFVPDGTSSSSSNWTDETLREVTRRILLADEATVEEAARALAETPREEFGDDDAYVADLLPRLQEQYGAGDPGTLVALLCMNFLTLGAGDALYIPADGIHAYLSGDIVECMARSNNVLNTGFCPPGDRANVDLFSKTLTFKAHAREDVLLPAEASPRGARGRTVVYPPPLREFDMLKTDLDGDGGNGTEVIRAGEGPAVAIVTDGEGVLEADGKRFDVKAGYIFFIAHGVEANWETKGTMQIFTTVV
ncbi:Mannose-6-phosphate isomerase [Colletotrichum tanaceti]|uniref:Mannose-6-phosphate isomerase n=1 Tax=Colletotrichum tanaceti TaxID=1306861 RepID=A0A4U6XI41_9PEZI|nr:Mannose-6-phosphate isomerase [Colletotrichum tanaceti]TKW53737.1 Mannose-6-phosphate isomerase [Colletotrichum tanaceti]